VLILIQMFILNSSQSADLAICPKEIFKCSQWKVFFLEKKKIYFHSFPKFYMVGTIQLYMGF